MQKTAAQYEKEMKETIEEARDRVAGLSNSIDALTSYMRIRPEHGEDILKMQVELLKISLRINQNLRELVLLDWCTRK